MLAPKFKMQQWVYDKRTNKRVRIIGFEDGRQLGRCGVHCNVPYYNGWVYTVDHGQGTLTKKIQEKHIVIEL